MIWVSYLINVAVFLLVFWGIYWIWFRDPSRRKGFSLSKDKPTLFDVRKLIVKDEKPLAIRLYAKIFKTNYFHSKKAVDELERSIQTKQFEVE